MTSHTYTPLRLTAVLLGLLMMGLGVFGTLTPAQAAVGTVNAPITGSGSTWSANALQQWIRNVNANYQWRINYSESGSTQGRNDFANGTADFGVSEIPYGIANSNEADVPPSRGFAYMPIVAGGTAFMYNLSIGGRRVTNLRLSGENVSKIFTGVITTWNDPAIAADNPLLALPAIPIVPVVRSDGSGTSAQFTAWMRQEHSAIWNDYCPRVGREFVNGACGITSNYPTVPGSGFVSQSGASGVAGYVRQPAAAGAITFVEYSYALNARFPVVKVLNDGGYYSEPTASNVAVALLQAQINEDQDSQNYLTQDLTNVYTDTDPRAYALSSYSYIILPIREEANFTLDKGKTLGDFGSYFLCEGQQQAETLGYSPLPVNLVLGAQRQIQRVPGDDPARTGFSVGTCNNPTLDPNDPEGNALANSAPFPPDCDRAGATQCLTGTGGATDETPASGDEGGAGAGGGADGAGGAGGGGDAAVGADGAVDAGGAGSPDGALSLDANGVTQLASGTPQSLAASSPGMLPALAAMGAGVGLLAAALLPPLLGKRRRPTIPTTDPTRASRAA